MKVFFGKGRTYCFAEIRQAGKDFIITVLNKEGPHIGCIAAAEKGKKISTIKFPHHKEHLIFEQMAKKLSAKLKSKVVVLGGAHIEKPTKKELDELIKNLRKLQELLLKKAL